MINRFFYKLSGTRTPLKEKIAHSRVEILAWYHPLCIPAQHMALRVVHEGEEHYLSFSPDSLLGLSEKQFLELRKGVKASFVRMYDDELLIQGFRNAWPQIKEELNQEQLSILHYGSIKKVSDVEILEITKYFTNEKNNELRAKGHPSEIVILYSLDTKRMLEKINQLKEKADSITWASWAGTSFHQENTYNCASIVLEVLYEGGFDKLISSSNDLLGISGLLLGTTFTLVTQPLWITAIIQIVVATMSGRGLGGAYEGYTGIQSFLNLAASQGHDNLGSVLGLRVLTALFSAFLGAVKTGPVFPAFLTIPRDVLDLTHQAKTEEEAIYSFKIDDKKNDSQPDEKYRAPENIITQSRSLTQG